MVQGCGSLAITTTSQAQTHDSGMGQAERDGATQRRQTIIQVGEVGEAECGGGERAEAVQLLLNQVVDLLLLAREDEGLPVRTERFGQVAADFFRVLRDSCDLGLKAAKVDWQRLLVVVHPRIRVAPGRLKLAP